MPGPKATYRGKKRPASGVDQKAAKRLARRLATYQGGTSEFWDYRPNSGGGSQRFHRPGSQNRKKS